MPGEGDRQDLPEINGSNHIAGDNADSSSQNNRQPSVLDEESESEEEESTSVIELSPYAVAMGLLISGQTLFWRAQGANGVEAVLLYKQAIRNFKLVLQTHDMFSEQVLNQLRSKLALSFIKVGEYLFGQARVERLCEREIRLYAQSETQYREALKQFGMLMRSYEGKNEEKAETAWINHACTRLSIGLTLNGRASSGEDDTKLQLYEDAIREFKAAETEYRTLGLTGTERYRREISFGIMRALLYASSASLKKQMLSVKDLEQKSRICDELMKKVDAAEAEYRNAITENYVGSVGETKVMFVRLDFAGQFKKLGYEFLQALDTADMEQKIHLCEQAITNFQQAEKWYRVLAA